jgi:hypothetical protein
MDNRSTAYSKEIMSAICCRFLAYFIMLSVPHTVGHPLVWRLVNNESERIQKEAAMTKSRWYPCILPAGTEENYEKFQSG